MRYKREMIVWTGLMALLAMTFGAAWLRIGTWNTVISFTIAVAKAALVMAFFMHLPESSRSVRIAAFTAVFMLGILFAISGSDYATRRVDVAPWQPPRQLSPIPPARR